MAFDGKNLDHPFVAGEDLTAAQYKKMYLGSDGLVYDDSNSNARQFVGVAQNGAPSGGAVNVVLLGITKLVTAGATTTGSKVAGNTNENVGIVLAGTAGAGMATALITGMDKDTTA